MRNGFLCCSSARAPLGGALQQPIVHAQQIKFLTEDSDGETCQTFI